MHIVEGYNFIQGITPNNFTPNRYELTLRDPANPSDSVKKYANGIAKNMAMYVPRNIWFHNPVKKQIL